MSKSIIGITPFPAQVNILNDRHDNIIVAASRRLGKSQTAIMFVLRACLTFDSWIAARGNPGYKISTTSPAIVAVVFPTRQMAKDIFWKPVMELIERTPAIKALVKNVNNTDLTVSFHGNRPDLVVGSTAGDDGNRWRGRKIVGLVCDETQDQPYSAVMDVLKIAMTDIKGSQMLCIGTPKGKGNNTLWRLKVLCDQFPELYSFHHYTVFDNPYLPQDKVIEAVRTTNKATFLREFCADFLDFPGKIYQDLSEDLIIEEPQGRHIENVLAVDWGSNNCALAVLALYENLNERYWVLVDTWQNKSGASIANSLFYNKVTEYYKKYNAAAAWCDQSDPGGVLSVRELGATKALTGFNKHVSGVAQVSNLLYQKKLLFLDNQKMHPNHVTGREVYELFCSYSYREDKDGTVIEEIKEGQDDHLLDCIRLALSRPNPADMAKKLKPPKSKILESLNSPNFNPTAAYVTSIRSYIR